jgi:type IV pilus assembly protein PilC
MATATATKSFNYQSIDPKGVHAKGKIEATNEAAAAQLLRGRGVVPLSISEAGRGLSRDLSLGGLSGRVKLKDLSIFSRQFATLISSGMALIRSLSILEEQTSNARLKKAVGEVRADVGAGSALSTSMAKHDTVFPTIMIAMIRAGEAGGLLDTALERIASNLEKDAALRGKIKSALTYPVIVLGFSGIMIAAVLVFIVPIFEKMFEQLGGKLPMPTQIIVTASNNLTWGGPLLIAVAVTATVLVRRRLKTTPSFRLSFDRLKLRVPVFGPLFRKIAISRFARNLGTLLGVGVPVLQALNVVGATTGNAVITGVMQDLQTGVRDGSPMSARLSQHKVFPQMVTQMIQVGEESGQISNMLDKIADFYDREVDSAADALTSALEPIMVVVMGATIGGMVICLYLPMFTIYENIGK